jgi:hypothetical protein
VTTHSITLDLPEPLYRQILERARAARHAVEDEAAAVLQDALSRLDEGLPASLRDDLDQLQFLDDEGLWKTARIRLPDAATERMDELVARRDETGLTAAELAELQQLLTLVDRVMLTRAEAAVQLQRRGFDINSLGPEPRPE